jgi:hypothetical protein
MLGLSFCDDEAPHGKAAAEILHQDLRHVASKTIRSAAAAFASVGA